MKNIKLFEGFVEEYHTMHKAKDKEITRIGSEFNRNKYKLIVDYMTELENDVCIPLTDNYDCKIGHLVDQTRSHLQDHHKLTRPPYFNIKVDMVNDFDLEFLSRNLKEFELNLKSSRFGDMNVEYYLSCFMTIYGSKRVQSFENRGSLLSKLFTYEQGIEPTDKIDTISFTIFLTK